MFNLGDTPQGSLVQQPDGSMVFLPPGAAPPFAPPPDLFGAPPQFAPPPGFESGPPPGIEPGAPPLPPPPAPVSTPAPAPLLPPAAVAPSPAAMTPPTAPPPPSLGVPAAGPVPPPDAFDQEQAAANEAGRIAAEEGAAKDAIVAATIGRRNELEAEAENLRFLNEQKREALGQKSDAAWQAYANHKVREPRPGAMHIIAMMLGGIGAAMAKSTKNPALDMWEAKLAESLRQQEADRARLGQLADRAGRETDKFVEWAQSSEARHHQRMAGELETMRLQLEGTAAKYGGATAKANAAVQGAQIAQRRDAHAAAAKESEWQHQDADRKFKQDQIQADRSYRMQGAQLAESRAGRLQNARQFERQQADAMFKWGAENVISASRHAADLAHEKEKAQAAGNPAALKLIREQEERLVDKGVKSPIPTVQRDESGKPVIGKDGKPVLEFGYLSTRDGKPVMYANGPGGEEARKKMSNAMVIARLTDDLVNLIDEHGGEVDTLKGEAWTKMQSLSQYIGPKLSVMLEQGVISKDDAVRFEKIAGGDPTAFRGNPITGLRAMRESVVRDATASLQQGSNYDRDDLAIPENTRFGSHAQIKNTPAEDRVRKAEAGLLDGAAGTPWGGKPSARLERDTKQAGGPIGLRAKGGRPEQYLTDAAEAEVLGLAAGAKSGDPQALAGLKALARSQNPVMRQAAAEAAYKNRVDLGEGLVGEEQFQLADAPIEYLRKQFGGGF